MRIAMGDDDHAPRPGSHRRMETTSAGQERTAAITVLRRRRATRALAGAVPRQSCHDQGKPGEGRAAGHLCGRRLYEDMLGWDTAEQTRTAPLELEFARIWKAVPKVVFSATLTTVEGNARLARADVGDEAAEMRNQPGAGIVSVGGATLAASLAAKDLIEEYRLFVSPVVLGGGTPYFPPLPKRLHLELVEIQTFSQVVYLRYRRV